MNQEADILREIDELCGVSFRQPGDIDVKTMAEHFHVSTNAARDKMRKLAESGKFQMIKVLDGGAYLWVLRKPNE